MPGVPGRAGGGFGCCFQEGVHGAFPGVFPEKFFLRAPLVSLWYPPTQYNLDGSFPILLWYLV